MRHIKLVIGYDGTDFHGFQYQPKLRTVQEELERTLAKLLREEVKTKSAGRTDAGVHSEGQIVSFWTNSTIPTKRLTIALNSMLPPDIIVKKAEEVSFDFHPRFNAVSRVYRYLIDNRKVPSVFLRRYAWHIPYNLDLEAMRKAASYLVGVHDFKSFHASGSKVKSTVRHMKTVNVTKIGGTIAIVLEANSFLYQMVRIIVGTLVEIGLNKKPPEEMLAVIKAKDRRAASRPAPPHGLCLVQVKY